MSGTGGQSVSQSDGGNPVSYPGAVATAVEGELESGTPEENLVDDTRRRRRRSDGEFRLVSLGHPPWESLNFSSVVI